MSWFHEEAKYFKENGEVDIIKEALCGHDEPDAKLVDNVVYVPVYDKDENGNEVVTAMVVYTEIINEGDSCIVGLCPMMEEMGPAAVQCPESILKLLTPTDDFSANIWREVCWENVKKDRKE